MFLITLIGKDQTFHSKPLNCTYVRVHSADEKYFVFVVHSHNNEEFCLAAIEIRTKRVLLAHKIAVGTGW